jgi:hypothetical protein
MKRLVVTLLVLGTFVFVSDASARRLKVRSFTRVIAPGQLGTIIFDNPRPEEVKAISNCTAERLIAWVKSDIPILRIEQNGKQIWTSLGSYQTLGDSCIATFMAPVILTPGEATLFLVNDRDASVPYTFTVTNKIEAKLKALEGVAMVPLGQFRIIGEGFLPAVIPDHKKACDELEHNLGYSKMSKAEQWTTLNHRMQKDWDKLGQGDFLYIKQGGKEWRGFLEQCALNEKGLALDFTAPPDIKPGTAELTLVLRAEGKEVARTAPLTVNVQ